MKFKHLIVPTQYYDPETFQVNHLVALFLANGWSVTVIAPAPSYPSKSALRGRTEPLLRHERLSLCRFPTVKRDGSILSAILNSIIFVGFGSVLTLFYSFRYPKSHIFAVQYSPFTCILPAWLSSILLRRSVSLWIFDLWPQSISALLDRSFFSNLLYRLIELFISTLYVRFSNFFVSSPSFTDLPPVSRLDGVQLLYSWEPSHISPRLGSDEVPTSAPIRIVSIGNLGSAHDLETLEELLLITSSLNFIWTFVGGGPGMSRLSSFSASHQLCHVNFTGFLPKDQCLTLCSSADISVVPFKDSQISNTICYRFVSSLSVATPVISFGDNSVSQLVRSSSCGFILSRSSRSTSNDSTVTLITNTPSSLVQSMRCRLPFIRSSCRDSAFALYQSRFSERAAEASLSSFFADP